MFMDTGWTLVECCPGRELLTTGWGSEIPCEQACPESGNMAQLDTHLLHLDYNLVDTTFDRYTKFEGDLVFEHSLKINGTFKGTIKSPGFLYIGESAVVEADIEAGVLILEGEVKGNIIARERAELMSTARLYGDLETAKLQICDGVVFEGKCRMIKTEAGTVDARPAPQPAGPVRI